MQRQAVIKLANLPSAQLGEDIRAMCGECDAWNKYKNYPQESHWIPCSERLPEDSQFVLMTIRRMGEHYNHEPFISVGYISWNQSAWWCAHDGDCKSHDVRVDAWMPLPEPWRGEE